jgi:hypothetical protein
MPVLMIGSVYAQSSSTLPASPDPTKATAVVMRDKATFTIPVGQRVVWHWNLASTGGSVLEYRWEVQQTGVGVFGSPLFKAPDTRFGFSLFKASGAPREGSLQALIEAGQGTVWEMRPDGNGAISIGDVRVTSVQENSAVEIVVEPPHLKPFLTSRPKTVDVIVLMPGTTEQRYSIPVKYEDR